jgi:hypothetical protein
VRQEARFLIGPLVGVALAVTLTACGSSDNEADRVVGPPTSEVTATTEFTTTDVPEVTTTTATTTTMAPTTTVPVAPVTPAPKPPAMSTQELESLEAELAAIDAILNELAQNFAAD